HYHPHERHGILDCRSRRGDCQDSPSLSRLRHKVLGAVCRAAQPFPASASFTRSGVIGRSKSRTPVASKMALPMRAATTVIGGSPPPCGGTSWFSTSTVSIFGSHEKRGISIGVEVL